MKRSPPGRIAQNGLEDANDTKNLDTGIAKTYNNVGNAGVAELADAADLKSAGEILVGSSPTLGTM